MNVLPPDCPPLPELPALFWNHLADQIPYWQNVIAQPDGGYPIEAMRKDCIARIKTRLKRLQAGKNPGRAMFELSEYVACMAAIDSRN